MTSCPSWISQQGRRVKQLEQWEGARSYLRSAMGFRCHPVEFWV